MDGGEVLPRRVFTLRVLATTETLKGGPPSVDLESIPERDRESYNCWLAARPVLCPWIAGRADAQPAPSGRWCAGQP
jgi:hypothetical protein